MNEEAPEEPGEIVGSARYMSPEQLQGKEATPRSDIYSVGIVLYHCLTGSPPFSGDLKSLVQQQLHEVPESPRKLNRKVSYHMEAVVLKALSKDPAHRYRSARAMLDDLEDEGRTEIVPDMQGISRRTIIRRRNRKFPILASLLAGSTRYLGAHAGGFRPGVREYATGAERAGPSRPGHAGRGRIGGDSKIFRAVQSCCPGGLVETRPTWCLCRTSTPTTITGPNRPLINDGFKVKVVRDYKDGYANRGVTWGTEPKIGSMAPAGSTITIYATPKDLYQPKF